MKKERVIFVLTGFLKIVLQKGAIHCSYEGRGREGARRYNKESVSPPDSELGCEWTEPSTI